MSLSWWMVLAGVIVAALMFGAGSLVSGRRLDDAYDNGWRDRWRELDKLARRYLDAGWTLRAGARGRPVWVASETLGQSDGRQAAGSREQLAPSASRGGDADEHSRPGGATDDVPNLGAFVPGETSHVAERTEPPLASPGGYLPELAEEVMPPEPEAEAFARRHAESHRDGELYSQGMMPPEPGDGKAVAHMSVPRPMATSGGEPRGSLAVPARLGHPDDRGANLCDDCNYPLRACPDCRQEIGHDGYDDHQCVAERTEPPLASPGGYLPGLAAAPCGDCGCKPFEGDPDDRRSHERHCPSGPRARGLHETPAPVRRPAGAGPETPGPDHRGSDTEPQARPGPGDSVLSAENDKDFFAGLRWDLKMLLWMASEPFTLTPWSVTA